MKRKLEQVDAGELTAGQAEAVEDLRAEFGGGRERAELEMGAGEALEALALGD